MKIDRYNILVAFFIFTALLTSFKGHSQILPRYDFNIASQPVSDALLEFALARDLNLVYLADIAPKAHSMELRGQFSLAEALDTLLQGTELRASISNHRVIKIERRPQKTIKKIALIKPETTIPPGSENKQDKTPPMASQSPPVYNEFEEILVVAQFISPYNLGTTVSSTKTQRDFLNTSQIVNPIPKSLTRDIAARNYTEATQLASSVNFLERSSGVVEELRLRGFAYPSLKINGVGAHAYVAPVDLAFIENIEIAKGPGSVLFGRMEPGGIINMMLKKPFHSENSLHSYYGSDNYRRIEIDLSHHFNADTSFRGIGFIQHHGSTASLDLDDTKGVMFVLSHYLSNGSELNIHYRYEGKDALQQFGRPADGFDNSVEVFLSDEGEIEFIPARESDLRASLDESRHSWHLSIRDWLIGDWSADFHLQYDRYNATSALNYPVIEDFELEINGEVFDDEELTFSLLENEEFLDEVLEGLEFIVIDDSNLRFENDPFQFDTQFFSAEMTFYQSKLLSDVQFEQLYGANLNYSEPESLIWQTHDQRATFVPIEQAEVLFNSDTLTNNVKDKNLGVFAQWVVNWHDFTGFFGARVDYLHFEAATDGAGSSRNFIEPTFRIGGVYQLTDTSSIFVNYSESFTPQFGLTEVFDATRIEEDEDEGFFAILGFLEPAKSHQWEIGLKKALFNEKLLSSCSVFAIKKLKIASLITEQQSRGLECDIAGSIDDKWHISAGFSLLNANINAATEEDYENKTPRMTPKNSARLWVNRTLFHSSNWKARIGVGYRYVGKRFIDSENEQPLQSYHLVDIGLFADYKDNLSMNLMLRNGLDKDYIEGAFNAVPSWSTRGQARTLEAGLTYRF